MTTLGNEPPVISPCRHRKRRPFFAMMDDDPPGFAGLSEPQLGHEFGQACAHLGQQPAAGPAGIAENPGDLTTFGKNRGCRNVKKIGKKI